MNHMQSLLFITEYVQLKRAMMENKGVRRKIGVHSEIKFDLVLPPELPVCFQVKSSLVHVVLSTYLPLNHSVHFAHSVTKSSAIVERFKTLSRYMGASVIAMREVYEKYIERNVAPLEINIPCQMRKDLQSVLDPDKGDSERNIQMIVIKMECAVENVVQLMSDAAMRYAAHKMEQVSAAKTP